MTCHSLRPTILTALQNDAFGQISKAKANVEVYLANPVGIGEHPDILAAIQEQLDIVAENEERLQTLAKHFPE